MAAGSDSVDEGGWPFDFLEDVDQDFVCIICLLPMKEPQQISTCGHSMCRTCLEKVISRNPICPEDRQPIEKSAIFPDLKCNRRIMALKVRCQYSDKGCQWEGDLVDFLKRHVNQCGWKVIQCQYCRTKIVISEMKHISRQAVVATVKYFGYKTVNDVSLP